MQKPCLHCCEETIQSFTLQIIHEKLQYNSAFTNIRSQMLLMIALISCFCAFVKLHSFFLIFVFFFLHSNELCTSYWWEKCVPEKIYFDSPYAFRQENCQGVKSPDLLPCRSNSNSAFSFFCVLNKMFDCLGSVWCLNKEEMSEGDIPPTIDAKSAGSTGTHNRLPWPTGYQLAHSEF